MARGSQVQLSDIGMWARLVAGRLSGRMPAASRWVGRRMASTSTGSGAKKTSLWPWALGAGLVAGSSYYFFTRPSADPKDPIKTASDIINVSIDCSYCNLYLIRPLKNLRLKSCCLTRSMTRIILVPSRWLWTWTVSWFVIFGTGNTANGASQNDPEPTCSSSTPLRCTKWSSSPRSPNTRLMPL